MFFGSHPIPAFPLKVSELLRQIPTPAHQSQVGWFCLQLPQSTKLRQHWTVPKETKIPRRQRKMEEEKPMLFLGFEKFYVSFFVNSIKTVNKKKLPLFFSLSFHGKIYLISLFLIFFGF
jgi:hypothetical protein